MKVYMDCLFGLSNALRLMGDAQVTMDSIASIYVAWAGTRAFSKGPPC